MGVWNETAHDDTHSLELRGKGEETELSQLPVVMTPKLHPLWGTGDCGCESVK